MRFRLRQLCLVTRDLDRVSDELCAVFGLQPSVRDLGVERHGLRNVVLPVGRSFLEVVSPAREGTAAGRYLDRLGGDGGYMVILDGGDIPAKRAFVQGLGIRIALDADRGGYHALHLHPKDVGGSMLSFDSDDEGAELSGRWKPAGADWQRHVRDDTTRAMNAAVLQSPEPETLARRWARILDLPPAQVGDEWRIDLALGHLRFVAAADGVEKMAAIDLAVADPARVVAEAQARGLPASSDAVTVCGTRFRLSRG